MIETTPKQLAPSRTLRLREDWWSEDATWTLVEAWGDRFVELNRGKLRRKDWQFVADSVNAVHGHDVKSRLQCKNRMNTIKKKYKDEKARVSESQAGSTWLFFNVMDDLIGIPYRKRSSPMAQQQVVVLPQKRSVEIEKASDEDEFRQLARAIERLGEIYEEVEGEKQKQIIELEKQRMQFAKDMEVLRMQFFMDTHIQLQKIKQAKR